MTDAERIALERERTKRMFIQQVGSYFGVDQSFAETDGLAVNTPGAYQVYGGAGYAVEGQPASQAQVQTAIPGVVLLVVGLAVGWALLKRG
ncbi:hypothetical protein [Hydrogenophaga intermedia]|uniref:hypothetical protein n=1 Tax=Hydrogenophaga intermedia TaxID=65786 RepID=UPI002043E26A|nr:hypothetical protein [Hydrogenophaga intermedia]MCM3565929.1 hypothetical protein [Hydrogenophaga intermedia]